MGSGQSNSTLEDVDIFMQELIKVAQKEDTNLLQTKIGQSSFGIETKNSQSKTVLRIAVEKRNLKAVKTLLKQKAINVNTTCENNETPLMVAANNGDLDILECLLEKQANVKEISSNGVSAILLAARNRHESCLKRLLEPKVEQGNSTQGSGNSNSYDELENALTSHLDDEGVLLLLQNISTTEYEKRELLCKVAKRGLLNCVKYLLDVIGELSIVIKKALTCALQGKNEECIRSVLMKYNQETGRRAIVRVMKDGLKKDCETLLQLESERHQTSSLKKLFQVCNNHSATSTVQTLSVCQDDMKVALRIAAKHGDSDLLRLLIKYLAEPAKQSKPNKSTSVNNNGSRTASKNSVFIYERALVAAAIGGHEGCVQVLIDEVEKFSNGNLNIYRSALRGALKKLKSELCPYCKACGVTETGSNELHTAYQETSEKSSDQSSKTKDEKRNLQREIQNCIQKINDAILKKLKDVSESFKNIKFSIQYSRVKESEDLIKEALALSIAWEINEDYQCMRRKILKNEHRETRAIEEITDRQEEILTQLIEIKNIFNEARKEAEHRKEDTIVHVFRKYKSEKMFAEDYGSRTSSESGVFNYVRALVKAATREHEDCFHVLIDEIDRWDHGLLIYKSAFRHALELKLCSNCRGFGVTEAPNPISCSHEREADRQQDSGNSNDQSSENKIKRTELQKRIQNSAQIINIVVLEKLEAFQESLKSIKSGTDGRRVKGKEDVIREALKLCIVLETKEDYRMMSSRTLSSDVRQTELEVGQTKVLKLLKEIKKIFYTALQEEDSTMRKKVEDVLRRYESEMFSNDNDRINSCEDDISIYYKKALVASAKGGHEDFVQVVIDEINRLPHQNLKIYRYALRGALEEYVGSNETESDNSLDEQRIQNCIQMINDAVLQELKEFLEKFKSIKSSTNPCRKTEDLIKEALKLSVVLEIYEDYRNMQRKVLKNEHGQTRAIEPEIEKRWKEIMKQVKEIQNIFHEALQEAKRKSYKEIMDVFKRYESEKMFVFEERHTDHQGNEEQQQQQQHQQRRQQQQQTQTKRPEVADKAVGTDCFRIILQSEQPITVSI